MKKFLIFYWINIPLLFGLFYWELSPLSPWINALLVDFSAWLTALTLPSGMMQGHNIYISEHYGLVIEKACNGIVPYLFFIASIFAFPASHMHKIKWAVYGFLAIMVINVFRIWLVTQFVLAGRENFSLAHDYIGNILVIVSALLLFILFVKTREKSDYSNLSRRKNAPSSEVKMTSAI